MPVALAARGGGIPRALLAVPGARLARAPLAEQMERVEPRRVPVPPGGLDRVRADERDVHELRLVRGQRRVGVEPARHAGLPAAVRARAEPAEAWAVVRGLVAVGPRDGDGAGGAVRVDPDGGDALVLHPSIVPRGPTRTITGAPCRTFPEWLVEAWPVCSRPDEPRRRPPVQALRQRVGAGRPHVRGAARPGLRVPGRQWRG